MDEMHRKYNDVAAIFPLMEGADFENLKADVRANGLLDAIWLHPDGSIIDGRNRHRACIETGTPPRFRTWDGTGSLVTFVVSKNLHRRHLTSSQRAVVALEVLPMLEAEAEEARREKIARYRRTGETVAELPPSKSRQQAAELVQSSARYVSDAKRLKRDAPDLLEEVRRGALTIPQAKRQFVRRQPSKVAPLPDDKYHVIYGDPPWRYDFSVDDDDLIEAHYATMSLAELCAMPVPDIAAKDSVLFLWSTSPKLTEALQVMKAWGFRYVTCMVWDKEWITQGYYARQQHELLLIGKRGTLAVPEPSTRPGSVVRERRTKFSKKPEVFYKILERMYPRHKRIELFAREQREGWTAWGNEV